MTKKQITTLLYVLAIAGLALYLAYVKGFIFANFESVSPKYAYELLQNDPKVALLDVRTPQEFSEGHIAGATLIPVQELSQNLSKLERVKDKKIIVYCHSGTRSIPASRILVENGFVPLNMSGGITAWKADGLSVTPF